MKRADPGSRQTGIFHRVFLYVTLAADARSFHGFTKRKSIVQKRRKEQQSQEWETDMNIVENIYYVNQEN
jgi:hypothetical protein